MTSRREDLAGVVDSIFWAFPPGDSRRADIRTLGDKVRRMEESNATLRAALEQWVCRDCGGDGFAAVHIPAACLTCSGRKLNQIASAALEKAK